MYGPRSARVHGKEWNSSALVMGHSLNERPIRFTPVLIIRLVSADCYSPK